MVERSADRHPGKGWRDMKCAGCPLFTSWSNESDRGEACGLFGDGWDSPFQYENKYGDIVGCYIDRPFIEKTDESYQEYLLQQAASWEAWMLETEKAKEGE